MTGKRWWFFGTHPDTRATTMLAEASSRLGKSHARLLAHLLADDTRLRVSAFPPSGKGPLPNPTLAAHGPTRFAAWHILSEGNHALADLYGFQKPAAARIARLLAHLTGAPVKLLDNAALPRELRDHPRSFIAANPSRSVKACQARKSYRRAIGGSRRIARAVAAYQAAPRYSRAKQGYRAKYLTLHGSHAARFRRGAGISLSPNPKGRKRRNPGDYVPVAETAKQLRAALKRHFPTVKFSVRSKSYSGGASITVSYVNGPRSADVDHIAQRFSGADFDPMIDLKTPRDSLLVGPDGAMRSVRYGSDYVFVNRHVSPTLEAAVIAQLAATWDANQWATMPDYEKERLAWRGVSAIAIPDHEPESVTVRRAIEAIFHPERTEGRRPNPKGRKNPLKGNRWLYVTLDNHGKQTTVGELWPGISERDAKQVEGMLSRSIGKPITRGWTDVRVNPHGRSPNPRGPSRWIVRDARGRIFWNGEASDEGEAMFMAERSQSGKSDPPEPWTAARSNPSFRVSGTIEHIPDAVPARRGPGRPRKVALATVEPESEPVTLGALALAPSPLVVPTAASEGRGLVPGERVTVPYTGRSSYFGRKIKRSRESAIFEGYTRQGDMLMAQVRVQRGRRVEDHVFPEHDVRRKPRSSRAVLSSRLPLIVARLERKVGGDPRRAAVMLEAAGQEFDAADARAHEIYPQAGTAPSKEYVNLRNRMHRLLEQIEALGRIHSSLAPPLQGEADPWRVANGRRRRMLSNPGRHASEYARGVKTFKLWHDFAPHRVSRVKAPARIPRTMVRLGELHSVVYRSDKWAGGPDNPRGKSLLYEHTTQRPRPVLATDPDGRDLFIVGGKMRVTADGLIH